MTPRKLQQHGGPPTKGPPLAGRVGDCALSMWRHHAARSHMQPRFSHILPCAADPLRIAGAADDSAPIVTAAPPTHSRGRDTYAAKRRRYLRHAKVAGSVSLHVRPPDGRVAPGPREAFRPSVSVAMRECAPCSECQRRGWRHPQKSRAAIRPPGRKTALEFFTPGLGKSGRTKRPRILLLSRAAGSAPLRIG